MKKMSFAQARTFIRQLKLKSVKKWQKFCSSEFRNPELPIHPNQHYKDEWESWSDFLGILPINKN